ncbi:hypothetical protein SETIT_2G055600v2 [Setaria italica]|uniref:Uncharacterized protein n=1 Tax=Setaria italica TaxID=4555 RepID=K3ZXT7_SETIT|nr:hypothetical protein SETIT_2G055600v2 [Setaria italica]
MMDTEGSEIHMGDLGGASSAKAEVRCCAYVRVGDELLVDGGMARFEVIEKLGPDVKCRCTDPGLLLPRVNLTFWRDGSIVRERNAMLPTISSKARDCGREIGKQSFLFLVCYSASIGHREKRCCRVLGFLERGWNGMMDRCGMRCCC